jgi:hypothetical protein
VAIVVPLPPGNQLSEDEQISLLHLEHFLGHYDRFFVVPEGSTFQRAGFESMEFPRRYFGSVEAHARLNLSQEFYARFRRYTHILVYHLDALVFSDQLPRWCATEYDYIGAPWLRCDDSPWVKRERVGNGGFALMRVQSALSVLASPRRLDPAEYWRQVCVEVPGPRRWLWLPQRFLKRFSRFNNVQRAIEQWPSRGGGAGSSDYFWADEAVKYWPEYKVAPLEVGLQFAFEVAPRLCLERNGGQLPFGCHAWPRYDRHFWEPFLLDRGHAAI